jgi:hypothetical protein
VKIDYRNLKILAQGASKEGAIKRVANSNGVSYGELLKRFDSR